MKYVNLHTHRFTNQEEIFEVVNQYPWEFSNEIPQYSIGIHPWYIDIGRTSEDFLTIEEKLKTENCLALGECGLDKRIEIPLQLQTDIFQQQIEIVQKTEKPIILHCVAAFQEVIGIKKEMNIENPMIIHGFSKNKQVTKSLLDNGFYLSFGKYLLRNPELEEVFQYVPNDSFFLETDTIEETIKDVYKKASEYKKIAEIELKNQIEKNFKTAFQNKNIL